MCVSRLSVKMSVHEEMSVSAEELRRRLYQSFKKKGVLDTVKTQLRNQLIMELQRETLPQAISEKPHSLSLLASNSLVIHHLQSSGYEYTLSVFYPECGISKDKVFTVEDILQVLRISPQSPVYKNLVMDVHREQKGLLLSLLSEFVDHGLQSRVCNANTQTTDTPDHTASIVKKMQVIDEEYEVLRQKGQCWASVEARLAEYRKEMEEQAQAELKLKIQHFQEVEISQVQMEEREKCKQEVLEVRRQLERNYEMKSEALMSREKNAIERLQRQQQIEEREIHGQRQALLKEIESVRNRDAELRLRIEAFEKSCKLHEEKLRSSEEMLKKRELDVRKMEETYELKLSSEIRRHQLELKEDYARRTEALTENEKKNKEETAKIQREAAIVDARSEEHQCTLSELARVKEQLASEREKVCTILQQNMVLKKKLEGPSAYDTIRNEHVQLQAEVRLLKSQLEECQEEKQRLRQELNEPSSELLMLQVELKRLEAARHQDQEDFQSQKQVFHSQLAREVERCTQLHAQLLECEERTRWMSTHTKELKQQLKHTQQALENEVLRNPKPSLMDRSLLDLIPARMPPTDVYIGGYHDNLSDPGTATRGCSRSRNEGEEMVAAALNRVQELEKEAETLEEVYRSYRRKGAMCNITYRGTSPPSPRAPATVVRPIRAPKSRVNTEDFYAVTELNQHSSGHMTPPTVSSPRARRLSSTPVSASKTKTRAHLEQEAMLSGFGSQREVSLIPVIDSGENTHITPPSSPQLKSTARDNLSSSPESSPQPEKISIQDLTEPQADVVQSAAENKHKEERRMKEEVVERMIMMERMMEEEEERRRKKEERMMKEEEEERRMKETGRRDLQRLQQEEAHHREDEEMTGEGTEHREETTEVKTVEERGDSGTMEDGAGGQTDEAQDDPLRKYMLMMMQGRGREIQENVKPDESENQSPEPVVLSDHRDNSIATFSQEEADDDFW